MSYTGWIQQMLTEDGPLLLTGPMKRNPKRMGFKNYIFNFDSASGIRYEVDVRKPAGEMINIISKEDGSPFDMDAAYTVAMTAYRANGGGELLTKGARLSKAEIAARITDISAHDIRHYLMDYIRELGTLNPQPRRHWRFVPEEWAAKAESRERKILFAESNKAIGIDTDYLDMPM